MVAITQTSIIISNKWQPNWQNGISEAELIAGSPTGRLKEISETTNYYRHVAEYTATFTNAV